ncbi:MAG: helicase C-terminal domain-containing protein, partial [Coriobacteriales bacterium]|nr:helicase C-terminal domain-containing protein [Coriobacteriales bacterium]
ALGMAYAKSELACGPEEFVDYMNNTFLQTSHIKYISKEHYKAQRDVSKQPYLRTHFASGYFDAKLNDKTVQRQNSVRNAFNSPFRPFVLATTSVGQEGLDFHLYCRKIVHWNLPSNAIDLEQREGRINRYLCHAIRQNVAKNEKEFEWDEKFNSAKEKYGQNTSDMIPYWCLPNNYPFKYHIERIVPMYPFSQDITKYERIVDILALYRLTLGQPRQEELLKIIADQDLSDEEINQLFFDLSPYSKDKARNKY